MNLDNWHCLNPDYAHTSRPSAKARVSEVSVSGSCLSLSMNVRVYYSTYPQNSRNGFPAAFAVSTDFAQVSKKYFTRASVYGYSYFLFMFLFLFSSATKPYGTERRRQRRRETSSKKKNHKPHLRK